jgi:hypothetical protein
MTAKQNAFYWRTWSKVRKLLIELGGYSAAEADGERHRITADALGAEKSHTAFSNDEFDKILDAFQDYLVLSEGPTKGPKRAEIQPKMRLINGIQKTGWGDAYIGTIALDQFGTEHWRDLTDKQLVALRWTCISRARAKRKSAQPK